MQYLCTKIQILKNVLKIQEVTSKTTVPILGLLLVYSCYYPNPNTAMKLLNFSSFFKWKSKNKNKNIPIYGHVVRVNIFLISPQCTNVFWSFPYPINEWCAVMLSIVEHTGILLLSSSLSFTRCLINSENVQNIDKLSHNVYPTSD